MDMKFIAACLMLGGLFGSIGCTGVDKVQEPTQAKRVNTSKSAQEDDVPAAVSKLLPSEQLDARNAHAQSKLLNEKMQSEMSQLERSATAQRD
jgi:hypothetical protein